MATIEQIQEIANRGLQDKLPPEKREKFDELVKRGVIKVDSEPSLIDRAGQAFEDVGQLALKGAGQVVRGVESILPEPVVEAWRGGGQALESQLAERREQVEETKQAKESDEIGSFQAAVQFLGNKFAAPYLDVVGQAVTTPVKSAVEALPESVKETASETFSSAWDKFSETGIGKTAIKAVQTGGEIWSNFKENNPQEAKTVEAAINIGLAVAPVKKDVIGGRASKMEARAARQIARRKADYVDELILPKETPLVRKEMAKRATETGVLRKRVISLDSTQQRMSKEVQKIKGVSPNASLTKNGSIIREEVRKQANELDDILKKSKVRINPDAVKSNIRKNVSDLIDENPLISSDTTLVNLANHVERNAHRIIAKYPDTPHGVLQARRQFDSWARKLQKGVHDRGDKTGPLKEVVASVRDGMNNTIHNVVPSADVKRRLTKQSMLLRSLDNVDAKMFGEGANAVTRTIDRLMNIPQARNKIVGVGGTLLGMGIVGGSAMLSGPIAVGLGLTGATVAGGKFIMGPKAKVGLAKLLRGIDAALLTTKKPGITRQLRADRAIIADMIKNSEIVEEENGNEIQQ